jgi:superfamily II DNA or RNA helicase
MLFPHLPFQRPTMPEAQVPNEYDLMKMTDYELRLEVQRSFDRGMVDILTLAMKELVERTPDDSEQRKHYEAKLRRMVRLLERGGERPGSIAPQNHPGWLVDARQAAKAVKRPAASTKSGKPKEYYVYAVLLWGVRDIEEKSDRGFSIYVGSSVTKPETRLRSHLDGIKSSKYVEYFAVKDGLLPELCTHLNPLPSRHDAQLAEFDLARALRRELLPKGIKVFGGAQELMEGEELPDPETPENLLSWLNGTGEIPRWLLRGAIIKLPARGLRDIHAEGNKAHSYQEAAVKAICSNRNGVGRNGVVSLPTGAGKTRIAIEAMATVMSQDPEHLFLWVSYPTVLIDQSLGSFLDWADAFKERRPRVCFLKRRQASGKLTLFDSLSVAMMLRSTWVELMKAAAAGNGPLAHSLAKGRKVTVIWDECHLMASQTQRQAWKELKRVGLAQKIRLVGLSATPGPNEENANAMHWMQDNLPPQPGETWPFHHFLHRTIEQLREDRILSEIDYSVQRKGWFDIPPQMLQTHQDEIGIPQKEEELKNWAQQFNRHVMGDPQVLKFLARQLAHHSARLGKTLVFVPSIAAANCLYDLLIDDGGIPRDMVSLAHSELTQLGGLAAFSRHTQVAEQITRFKQLGSQSAIMITVTLLTTGFDDPRIQTVLLARLTMSQNLFWQMIGRGTRGPEAGRGTKTCTVIDPIRLTEVFNYAAGYKASLVIPEADEADEPVPDSQRNPEFTDGWTPPAFLLAALSEDAQHVERGLRAFLNGGDLDSDEIKELVAQYGLVVDTPQGGGTNTTNKAKTHNAWASILVWYVHRVAKQGRQDLYGLLELLRGKVRTPDLVERFLSILKRVIAGELTVEEAMGRTAPPELELEPDQSEGGPKWQAIESVLRAWPDKTVQDAVSSLIPERIDVLETINHLKNKGDYIDALKYYGTSPAWALQQLLASPLGSRLRAHASSELGAWIRVHDNDQQRWNTNFFPKRTERLQHFDQSLSAYLKSGAPEQFRIVLQTIRERLATGGLDADLEISGGVLMANGKRLAIWEDRYQRVYFDSGNWGLGGYTENEIAQQLMLWIKQNCGVGENQNHGGQPHNDPSLLPEVAAESGHSDLP